MHRGRGATWYFLFSALVPGHLFGWTVEWAAAVGSTLCGIILYDRFAWRYPKTSRIGVAVLIAVLGISFSSYLGTLFRESTASGIRDLIDLIRPLMLYFSCVLGLALAPASVADLRRACKLVLAFSLFCGAVLAFQVPSLEGVINAIYGSTKTVFAGFFVRLSVPFENPNFLGLFAVQSLCMAMLASKSVDWVLATLALLAVALTGSRTAWATSVVVVLVFFLLAIKDQALNLRLPGGKSIFAVLLLVGIVLYYSPAIVEGNQRALDFIDVVRGGDLTLDASYSDRVRMRADALTLVMERPLFGVGAMKYTSVDVVDNQYVGWLLRFGVVGTALTITSLAFAVLFAARNANANGQLGGFLMICAVLCVWAWTGSFFDNVRLASLSVMFCAAMGRADAGRVG